MALKTRCQTPGAIFHTKIEPKKIEAQVDLPFALNLSEKEAKLLERNLHNVLELALASFFNIKN